jgi:hypothetical protein
MLLSGEVTFWVVRGVRFGGCGEVIGEDQKRATLGVGMIGIPGTKGIM